MTTLALTVGKEANIAKTPYAKHWSRAIILVDMNAFFAAIEQLDRPELRGNLLL